MTAVTEPAESRLERLELNWEERPGLLGWLTTVDHKRIGLLYLFATLAFFLAGGVEALLIRTQLARPESGVVSPETFSELFTTHGVTMIFLAVIPMQIGAFGNYLVPLMIGARDMAFPRLNALSFWLFLASGCFIYTGVFMGLAPNAGWFDYVPLALKEYDPGLNIDFYALGLIFTGLSSTATAINLVVTIFKDRAPGMSLNRMPLFCFAMLATSFSLIFALPPLTVDLVFLELQRNAGFHFFDVAHGGDPLLWQHLFWIFGHPEVYIIVLPAFGIATSIIPTFSRRTMLAFPLVALAELLVAFIGFGVWAHHMFTTGLPTITVVFFAAASMMVVIPSSIQVFAWTFTVVMGRPRFTAPLLFIGGFIVFFVLGGLSGISFAAIPIDQATTDTYYVVAHFHFIIFGAAVFPLLGGLFYWFPKVTGRLYHEGLAKTGFWLAFAGTAVTFFPMHIVGLLGMTRRVYTYSPDRGWSDYNLIETIGGFLLAAGLVLIAFNLFWSRLRGAPSGPDPFHGGTLEWTIPSPPPHYNFAVIPHVSSPYPNWDVEDRERDRQRLVSGEGLLEEGHETLVSSVKDGELDAVLDQPAESALPIVIAFGVTVFFALVLTSHYYGALAFAALVVLATGAWHRQEPESTTSSAAASGHARSSSPPGWWGMVGFVATEATLFGSLIGAYAYLRFKNVHWPPDGIPEPEVVLPLVLAAALAATSIPMALAASAAKRGLGRRTWTLIAMALAVQSAVFGIQLHRFAHDLGGFAPQHDAYASIYYTLLGASHAHIALGLLLNAWLVLRLATGLTRYRVVGVRSIAFYWHAVNILTVVVTAVLVSAAL